MVELNTTESMLKSTIKMNVEFEGRSVEGSANKTNRSRSYIGEKIERFCRCVLQRKMTRTNKQKSEQEEKNR